MVKINSKLWINRYGSVRKEIFDALEESLIESKMPDNVMAACMQNFHRGKCIRGIMSFMVYMMTNHSNAPLKDKIRDAVTMGALPEALHIASLIHDDIVDRSETRRGDPTVYYKYGDNIAAVAGDVWMFAPILSDFYSIPPPVQLLDINQEMRTAGFTMSVGEMKDSLETDTGEGERSGVEEYLKIIGEKTLPLIRASATVPATANGASKMQKEALREYSNNVGYAFQIRDDVIDIVGSEKEAMKDLRKNIDIGSNYVLSLYHDEFGDLRKRDVELLKVGKISRRMVHCVSETQDNINDFIADAIKCLHIFEHDKYKKGLIDTAVFCGTRER
jgi:Geranylgeranyl pyrophosphate synthase